MNDYLYDVDEAQYSFVRVPKLLLQHEAYQRISSEAKLLYSLLLDRVGLSHKNGWRDKQNRIYIIYPIAEIMEEMNCGKNKAVQLLDELEQKAGLIERKRQGLGKPNLIYVKSFSRTVDNFGERHFLKFENQTSGGLNIKPQEVSESNPTNTDNKKTNMNQTDLSFLPGRESKRNDAYAQYEAYFREELEIPILIQGNRSENLISSDEGQMEWVEYDNLTSIKTVDDFDELIRVINSPGLTEFQYLVSGDEWTVSIR